MKKRYSIDPEDSARSETIESTLLQELELLQPSELQRKRIRERLFQRIHANTAAESCRITIRSDQGSWQKICSGVQAKALDKNTRAFLFDLAPGASLPQHRHHADEECLVLRGSANLGELKVNTGDYHLARSGSHHGRIFSETGALLYLRGIPVGHSAEIAFDFLTAFLPGTGKELITIHANEGEWSDLAMGVTIKFLFHNEKASSSIVKIAAETSWNTQQKLLTQDVECLLLEGDAFLGDTLLNAGDWQLAPAGSEYRPISTDSGAMIFVRSSQNITTSSL